MAAPRGTAAPLLVQAQPGASEDTAGVEAKLAAEETAEPKAEAKVEAKAEATAGAKAQAEVKAKAEAKPEQKPAGAQAGAKEYEGVAKKEEAVAAAPPPTPSKPAPQTPAPPSTPTPTPTTAPVLTRAQFVEIAPMVESAPSILSVDALVSNANCSTIAARPMVDSPPGGDVGVGVGGGGGGGGGGADGGQSAYSTVAKLRSLCQNEEGRASLPEGTLLLLGATCTPALEDLLDDQEWERLREPGGPFTMSKAEFQNFAKESARSAQKLRRRWWNQLDQ